MQKFKKVFDTWKWREYIPFWRNHGTPMIEFMNDNEIPFREWNDIFSVHGNDFYEVMKKLTLDRMLDQEFDEMTDNEKAMLGTTIFLEFMKQLQIEMNELDKEEESN